MTAVSKSAIDVYGLGKGAWTYCVLVLIIYANESHCICSYPNRTPHKEVH